MITDAILKGQKVILVPYQTEHVQVKLPNRALATLHDLSLPFYLIPAISPMDV